MSAKGKSQAGAKAKNLDAYKPRQYRPRKSDANRQKARGVKAGDRAIGRNTQEVVIEWPGSYCPDGHPHYLVETGQQDSLGIFCCTYCHKHKLLPRSHQLADEMTKMVKKLGIEEGYRQFLATKPSAQRLAVKLQLIWTASQSIEDDDTLVKLVSQVMAKR